MAIRDTDTPAKRALQAGLVIGAATLVAGAAIVFVQVATRTRIAAEAHARQAAQIESLLGALPHDNDVLADVTQARDPDLLGTTAPVAVYRARLEGRPVGVVMAPVAPDGYAGSIELRVAIRADGRVLAVRVVRHQETAGFGDAIEERKSDWIRRFSGRSLGDPPPERWKVRKDGGDFDQFTGATVTPRAVVRAVSGSLAYFQQHRDELFAAPATMSP